MITIESKSDGNGCSSANVNLFAYIIIMTIITHHYKVELFENNVELKKKKYM